MYTHVMVGSNDIARSKIFYDALFTALGGKPGMQDPHAERILYLHNGAAFMVSRPIDGQAATFANGGTIGLGAADPAQLDAAHAAAVANGGTAIEAPVGERQTPLGPAYLGYLRDPDGNKLCLGCRLPKA
ncbi:MULTISPECIES: VOC family protein [Sphingomonas]|jgi:catechol 2,3-dioxygenase-like lactoylglutathione lyase family enzyme|uniref:VOC family protein n=1 Tax=Sphingomonas zeae TaxID=1646122 RepID=A0A7Y6EIN6_9SPHN|nr:MULTISPECIES: VOC family protein [Sphingomonas]MDK8185252.1 VOC family protein [Sphingomonas zeae]MDK8214805.1 VOC family protein [Sphingomonas sp. UMB7805-LC452B]NUU48531.1 VOC family protein [Sphingomonas zeae]